MKPGLRLVSLNTILYYGPDKATRNMTDPAGQFKWLQKTLEESAQNQEKVRHHGTMLVVRWRLVVTQLLMLPSLVCPPQVYIIGHVPVGYLPFTRNITAMREQHNQRLVAICRKYSHVIAGHFYGHTHRDSVMVLLDEQGKKCRAAAAG